MLILSGLFRKAVIADNCALLADAAFSGRMGPPNIATVAIGTYAFAWQIYGDFSGYSDIARGSAQLLGFHFMVNFRQPYLATSLQDFWRRWHISLSSWLRDYVYHSLGGNRGGRFATYRNLFLTMLLGGIWHGAGFKYAVWGAWHGVFLSVERALGWHRRAPSVLGWARTFLIVTTGWVFFYAADAKQALVILEEMMFLRRGAETFSPGALLDNPVTTALCIAGIAYCFVIEPRTKWIDQPNYTFALREQFVTVCLMAGALIFGFSQFTTPFLYFQF
jgi:D-alanyl-lipoteichoic acid acyltransferase DltB (MBOAT superfamily)